MAKLKKDFKITYIPGDPGQPGNPGSPYQPAYCVTYCTVQPEHCYTTWTPIYCYEKPASGSLVLDSGWRVCDYYSDYNCTPAQNYCSNVCYPEKAEVLATPYIPPTPAEMIFNLQEGWNASAQSLGPIYPNEAYLFKVATGSNGVLLGLATEPWMPNVGQLPYGIMFSDGAAQVFEMNTFKEPLGNFFRNEEFIIGRADNYVLYYNMTSGQYVIRFGIPAAPTTPLHLFAMMYLAGDTVIT